MVLDDVAQKAHAGGPQGAVETAVPVVVRAGLFRVVPALGAAAPAGGGKVEHAGEKASLPDEQGQFGGVGVEYLAHGEGVVGGKGLVPQLAEVFVQPLPGYRVRQHLAAVRQAVRPVGGEVLEPLRLADVHDGVHPEARHALVQPPVYHLHHLAAHRGVLPVEIRLLFAEQVQVVKVLPAGHRAPHTAAEVAAPVGGRRAVFALAEIEILPVGAFRVGQRLLEPGVLVGAVVHHKVHHHIHAPALGLRQQAHHVLHGAEAGVDAPVVGDVVALVRQRAFVHRREPEDVRPQLLEIVQPVDDAGDVSHTVAV